MIDMHNSLEKLWDNILSRNPERIHKTFTSLDESSRTEIINHLKKMAFESGWNPEQIKSAKVALEVLTDKL